MCQPSTASCLLIQSKAGLTSFKQRDAHCDDIDGKECGYIVVPLVVPEGMDFDKFAETTAFRQVAQTITALSTQDERIADEFRAIEKGRISSGKIVEIDGDVPVGMK